MDIRKQKEGPVQRYKSSFLTSKWKDSWAVLYTDSTFNIYNERGESRPAESIFLKNVVPYVCVGQMTDRMPTRRPSLPSGVSIHRLVGVGMDPRAEKVHWVLFPSEKDLEDWFNEITMTLPKPTQPPPTAPGQAPPPYPAPIPNSGGYVPPMRYPNAPPPVAGYHQGNPTGGYSPQPQPQPQATAYQGYTPYPNQPMAGGYPQQQQPPPAQTVYIDRTAPNTGYASRGSSGLGSGLAGLGGGLLAGSLLGYGIGSFFTPHYGGGGGWGGGGWGGGGGYSGMGGGGYPGMGGGYVQDNDTYNVTNNYYNDNNDNNHDSSNQVSSPTANDSADYGQSEPTQNTDYDGGGGGWDDTGGSGDMFDSGGGFDSGDFGGGGFDGGGGDW